MAGDAIVVLDEAIVFQDANAAAVMRPGADRLLIRLKYSGLPAELYSRSGNKTVEEIRVIQSFSEVSQALCMFVCTEKNVDEFKSLLRGNWKIIALAEDDNSALALDSLPLTFATMIKKELRIEITLVGHCMNWKREKDLLQRGAFPLMPTSTLAFFPLDLSSSLEPQLSAADIVLTKATDEIVSVSKVVSDENVEWINFSPRFTKLDRFLREHPEIHVVDPTVRVMPLMDRVATQAVLEELPAIQVDGGGTVRPPRSLKVTGFDEFGLLDRLKSSNLSVPTIVKPQIACGASESHTMAIVFEDRGYAGLSVPLPAVIQEYVDHKSVIYKFYVLGEKLFFSTRTSTPDAAVLRTKFAREKPVILFDSLKTLPAGEPVDNQSAAAALDMKAMRSVAAALTQKLGLSIIGFDVVIHNDTHDHIVVDVNYFPTFKDVPDAEAVPAFWKSLQDSRNRSIKN